MNRNKMVLMVVGLAAAQLVGVRAASALCDYHNTVADGRFTPTFSVNNSTNDINVFFYGKTGRSYSAEVMDVNRAYNQGILSVNWGPVNTDCPVANIPGLHITVTFEPTTQQGAAGTFFRASFTAPSDGYYSIRIGNTLATSVSVRATVSDTTSFNPLWSTFGGFETFYRLVNTTNGTCTAKLTLTTDAGTVAATKTIILPASSSAPTANTGAGDMNVADNTAGFATISHDCPPGAIEVDGFLANYSSTPAAVLPIKVLTPRESTH